MESSTKDFCSSYHSTRLKVSRCSFFVQPRTLPILGLMTCQNQSCNKWVYCVVHYLALHENLLDWCKFFLETLPWILNVNNIDLFILICSNYLLLINVWINLTYLTPSPFYISRSLLDIYKSHIGLFLAPLFFEIRHPWCYWIIRMNRVWRTILNGPIILLLRHRNICECPNKVLRLILFLPHTQIKVSLGLHKMLVSNFQFLYWICQFKQN